MLKWLIRFLQGPSANQYEPSALHKYLMSLENKEEVFGSRSAAQQEAKRVRFIRDGRFFQ